MLVVGEKRSELATLLGKEYYVVCPHCRYKILFFSYPVRTCIGRDGCGGILPVDPKELMVCSKTKILYHFEKVGP